MPLRNKSVALTGGAGGIGALVAGELSKLGARLTVVDRVEKLPFEADYIRGDLSTVEGIAEVASALRAIDADVLVNLAGIQYFGPFEGQTLEHVQSSYTVNLVAPVALAQAVVPQMKRRGRGHIVNIGSIFGSIGFAHFVTYSSAKAGLRSFSEALRRELSGTGIEVTYVAPRAVKTQLNSARVMEYAALTKMTMDEPAGVAKRIATAIAGRKKDVYIGFPEGLFVRLNAVTPRLVDAALAKTDRRAAGLFAA
jgi:short-subunit dehydrogenase